MAFEYQRIKIYFSILFGLLFFSVATSSMARGGGGRGGFGHTRGLKLPHPTTEKIKLYRSASTTKAANPLFPSYKSYPAGLHGIRHLRESVFPSYTKFTSGQFLQGNRPGSATIMISTSYLGSTYIGLGRFGPTSGISYSKTKNEFVPATGITVPPFVSALATGSQPPR
ncbi:hypothetical protein A7K93_08590 [Candidatus Methylacidiphilum fumarolicum]|uniref:Uncharacterized protein n=2 Tax=Candidatus Methylacidiphilum fumarolicum TaxID=591154 RepID=I0JW55_METFB|nr:hypothetical protein [Candidatus Methylacidiphilum fumarolicum]MBW6415721.1 hypothetical protein [Candidatus Methylacidiphilum fumarolicum]TFE68759.1 hypothetical protein A7K73_07270 [Candidatus Methylacidiphilum fumarolicum]TFE71921.1 hypothetical protein A7K72_09935 [Candidatus Methylacidiphilum fumarolicum]TFE72456.1 hypothetical protein A7K93_08590 [Candidatus Methylacidiphilum fumarolicum]TFE76618.1 hypothetical protein A7D33_09035 [Candidatus Methylacidiphilum fumarolicum]